MRLLAYGLVLAVLVFPCLGETIIVDQNGSGDFTNIQAAIDYSWDGDTVLVRPGTYNQAIKFNGRRITLTSLDPDNAVIVASTIITSSSVESSISTVTFDFGENSRSVITGFTITGTGTYVRGIYCYASSPMILKNVIRSCRYTGVIGNNASPTISNNKIINNGYINNSPTGGIYGCNGRIENNIINGNKSYYGGGLSYCNGTIINNTIVENTFGQTNYTADGIGAGIYQCYGVIKNNIIAFNKAITGSGGIYTGGGSGSCHNSYNVFWSNTNDNFGGNAAPGIGDMVRNPLFAINGHWNGYVWVDGDYHLKSTAGRYDPSTETWVLDDVNSPCLDKGDPNDPIGVEPNPNGGRINIGVYGGTLQASKSPSGLIQPVCTEYPATDFNKDCMVDYQDFAIFTQSWLQCNLDPPSVCWQ